MCYSDERRPFDPFSADNIASFGHPRPSNFVAKAASELKVGNNVQLPGAAVFARLTEAFQLPSGLIYLACDWKVEHLPADQLCLVEKE